MGANIKIDLKEMRCEGVDGFKWLRIGSSGRILCTQKLTFRLHKKEGIYWLAKQLSASRERSLLHGVYIFM
jgi:hypothetical protein